MNNTAFSDVVNNLTLAQAQEWAAQSEPFMHVVDTFDQVLNREGSAIVARVEAIEARFNQLLSASV